MRVCNGLIKHNFKLHLGMGVTLFQGIHSYVRFVLI